MGRDIHHSEAPNHLGYKLAKIAGLSEDKCWKFDVALSIRFTKHPHFCDNPDSYYKRVIETYQH